MATTTPNASKATAESLPVGVGRVPEWWMECTPHHVLDLEEEAARRQLEAQMVFYYSQLAAMDDAGVLGPDGQPLRGPDGRPLPWSSTGWAGRGTGSNGAGGEGSNNATGRNFKTGNIQIDPKLFGIDESDPDYQAYLTGAKLPPGFLEKMQEMFGKAPESEGIYNNLHQTDYGRYGRQAEQPEFKPAWAKMKLRTTQTGQKVRTGQYDDSPNKHIRRYADKEAGVAAVPSLSPRRKEGISVPPVNAEIAGAPFVETTPVVTPQRSSTVAAPTTTTTSVGNGAAVTTITTAPSTTSAVPQTVAVVATPPEDDSTDKKGGLKIIRKVRKVRKVRRDVQAHEEDVSTTPPPPVVVPDPVPTERMNYKLSDYYYNAKATPVAVAPSKKETEESKVPATVKNEPPQASKLAMTPTRREAVSDTTTEKQTILPTEKEVIPSEVPGKPEPLSTSTPSIDTMSKSEPENAITPSMKASESAPERFVLPVLQPSNMVVQEETMVLPLQSTSTPLLTESEESLVLPVQSESILQQNTAENTAPTPAETSVPDIPPTEEPPEVFVLTLSEPESSILASDTAIENKSSDAPKEIFFQPTPAPVTKSDVTDEPPKMILSFAEVDDDFEHPSSYNSDQHASEGQQQLDNNEEEYFDVEMVEETEYEEEIIEDSNGEEAELDDLQAILAAKQAELARLKAQLTS